MPMPSLEDFWTAVVRSRLVEPADVDAVRRDVAAAGQPDVRAAAAALVQRGMLTRWQAKRLAGGDAGPFFVGDYRLNERHEGPGSALLFTARHEPSRRTVSLVLLNGKICRQVEVWTAIVERTTAAHRASDPMLSRTWALEQADRTRFVVCEAVAGETLADELARLGPLSTVAAGQLVLQIARAVQEMHAAGRVHGGLSLDAVIREPTAPGAADRSGRVRLLQFPLVHDPHLVPLRAQAFGADEIARLGRRASYVAPELLLPGRACDTRSDVYALGCMLHALLAGVAPCWQGDPAETLRRAAFAGPEPLGPPRVPVEVASLVGFMTARDPQARYATAADAAHAIATCLGLVPAPVGPVLQTPVSSAVRSAQVPMAEPAVGIGRVVATANGPVGESRTPAMGPAGTRQPGPATSATSVVIQRRARRMQLIGTGIAGAVLLGAAIVIARNVELGHGSGSRPSRRPGPEPAERSRRPEVAAPLDRVVEPVSGVPAQVAPVSEPPTTTMASVARQLVVDDVTLPWASPTSGEPPTLAYLPPGSQVVLLARPADILAGEEGRRFVRALGPAVAAAIDWLAKTCGCQPADVEMLQAGWQANERGEVTGGFAIRLVTSRQVPPDDAARAAAWGATTPQQLDGETILTRAGLSLWVPSAEAGRVLVLAPESLLKAIVEQATAAKPAEKAESSGLAVNLSPDLAAVAAMLDQTRHLTLFGQPQALGHDGRGLLAGPLVKLVEPLGKFLGESVQAAAASLHFGTSLYAELDAVATPDVPASKVAPHLLAGVDRLATAAEDYCSSLDPDPYGRKLVMRLPGMIRVLAGNARAGAEGRGAVVNAYLPGPAAHNLALAAELALAQPAGASAGQALAAVTAPQDALGKLQKKITLVFAKDTLEKTIQMVSEEVGVPMEILGPDLQLEGITKNQSFGLDETEKSAEQVLRVILAKANPDGKLVFVVRKKDGAESIEITTRAAVAKRGDTLPPGQ